MLSSCGFQTNLFAYSDSAMGGFLRLGKDGWGNLVVAAPTTGDGAITEGQVRARVGMYACRICTTLDPWSGHGGGSSA